MFDLQKRGKIFSLMKLRFFVEKRKSSRGISHQNWNEKESLSLSFN